MQKYLVATALFFVLQLNVVIAQKSIFDAGIRIQKSVGLYWENGFSLQYSNGRLRRDQLYFGFSYITSRLGTAVNSNAIKQDNFVFDVAWYFRSKHSFRPITRFNFGYFRADYEAEVFDVLPNTSLLLSPELGAVYETKTPLKVMLTFGYNLITGDGESGPGTVYPLFIQSTLSWSLFRK